MSTVKPRIAVLSFAHMHAYSYVSAMTTRPDVDFVGIWDEDASRGAHQAQTHGTRFFPALDALLAEGLDGAMVCSDNTGHRALVEKSANAGVRAILCEKPIATTIADARAMVDVCRQRGAFLGIAFPCRYSPSFARAREAARDGRLGEIVAIRATNHG